MNKHQAHDLKQMQSLPLEAKIRMSERRIEAWFDHWNGEVYVSFSGGKDSTVLADIVARFCKKYGWKLYLLFVNTGLEYPEIQKFVRTFVEWLRTTYSIDVHLDVVRPEMRFDDVIKNYGYPVVSKSISKKVGIVRRNGKECETYKFFLGTKKTKSGKPSKFNCKKWAFLIDADFDSDYFCCEQMKKIPFKKYEEETVRKPIIGTLASESETREAVWMKHGCNAFESSHPSSQPLSFWTDQDILHYIKKFSVPYCSVYGDIHVKQPEGSEAGQINVIDYLECWDETDILETTGCSRTGCIFCCYGITQEDEPNRFQQMKQTHPRQYEYCIGGGEMVDGKWQPNKKGLGLGHVLDYIGVKY